MHAVPLFVIGDPTDPTSYGISPCIDYYTTFH
jgi:hypothetical protein